MHSTELEGLKDSILFLYVNEIKEIALKLELPANGTKMKIIDRIIHFLETGEIKNTQKHPQNSYAKKGESLPLRLKTLMLKGAYKNDLSARNFFKHIVGDHFHFTAFGIDFLNERWLAGKPPTYGEFAIFWQAEYERRKNQKPVPKAEWAYINFTQAFIKNNPGASKKVIISAWEQTRSEKLALVNQALKKLAGI